LSARSHAAPLVAGILIASLAIPPASRADGVTWLNTQGDNKYNDKLNWDCNCVPNNTLTKSYDLTVPSGSADLNVNNSPTINSLLSFDSNVNILAGKTLTLGTLTNGGEVNVNNNATLNVAAGSNSAVTVTNNGTINLSSSGKATSLILNGDAIFTLTGTGTVSMSDNTNNQIAGQTGSESLVNDVGHTIEGAGTISNLTSFTNLGTLISSGTKGLSVSTLSNWDGSNLNGGAYNVYANMQLAGIASGQIGGLQQGANVTINGPGMLTGDGTTNALSSLNNITDSSLTFATNAQITPTAGTLTVSTSGLEGLTEASLNLFDSKTTLDGSLANNDLGNSSTVTLGIDSKLTVTGSYSQTTSESAGFGAQAATELDRSTLAIGGTFSQDIASALTLNDGSKVTAAGLNNLGTINLNDGASVANFRGGSFANFSSGTLTGGSYNLTGTLYYDGGKITTLQDASVTLNEAGAMLYGSGAGKQAFANLANINDSVFALYASSGLPTITPQGGTFTISGSDPNAGAQLLLDSTNLTIAGKVDVVSAFATLGIPVISNVTVQNGSTLTVNGLYTQSAGASTNLTGGSTLFAQGFRNEVPPGYSGAGSISVDATSVADFRTGATDTFTNLKNGTLTGGAYAIAGLFYYDAAASGGAITALKGANVTLTGTGQMLYGGAQGSTAGTQAFLTLDEIRDSALTLNSATALPTIAPASGTLAVVSDGVQSASLTLNGTTLSIAGNLTSTNQLFAGSSVMVQAGSTLGVTGFFTQNNGTTTVDASALNVTGAFTQTNGSITTLQNGAQMSAGTLTNTGSTLSVLDTGSAQFGGNITNLSANGTLGGNGFYQVEGTLLYDGGGNIAHIAAGTTIDLIGTGSILNGASMATAVNALSLKSNAGTLQLDFDSNGGASVTPPGSFHNTGAITINSLGSMTVNGNFHNESGGTVQLNGAGASLTVTRFFNNAAGALLQVGNTFDVDPTFTAHGFLNNGTLVVGQGSTAQVVNLHNLSTTAGVTTLTGGTWSIEGTFSYQGAGINVIGAGTAVTLDARNSGTEAAVLDGNGTDALSGLDEVAGTLSLSGGQTETVGEGASDFMVDSTGSLQIGTDYGIGSGLTGTGFLTIDEGLTDDGTVAVGDQFGVGGGALTLVDGGIDIESGSYTQTANGTLILDIDNDYANLTDSGQTGAAHLAGTLEVNAAPGFDFPVGDTFLTIMTFGSLSGNFTAFDFSGFGPNVILQEVVNQNDIELEVVVTPEPATWLLFGAGILGLAGVEFRRRRIAARIQ